MKGIKISSRYARSLMELCKKNGQLDAVYTDMQLISTTIHNSRELSNLLNSPVVKTDTKVAVLNKVFGGEIGVVTHSFIKLLTEKGREGYLAEVAESFVDQVKSFNHVVTAQVITAVPMDESTRKEIRRVAGTMMEGEIELEEKVDETIIGGFVLRVGDKMVDTSVAATLRDMKRNFDDNPYIPDL